MRLRYSLDDANRIAADAFGVMPVEGEQATIHYTYCRREYIYKGPIGPRFAEEILSREDEGLPLEAPVPAPNPDWKWLSPTEKVIVDAATEEWQTAEQIARATGMPCSGNFRCLLTNLTERNILQSQQGKGYRLNLLGTNELNGVRSPSSG